MIFRHKMALEGQGVAGLRVLLLIKCRRILILLSGKTGGYCSDPQVKRTVAGSIKRRSRSAATPDAVTSDAPQEAQPMNQPHLCLRHPTRRGRSIRGRMQSRAATSSLPTVRQFCVKFIFHSATRLDSIFQLKQSSTWATSQSRDNFLFKKKID